MDLEVARKLRIEAARWSLAVPIGPGRLGGRPPVLQAFLEALLKEHDERRRLSSFGRRLFPVANRHREWTGPQALRTFPYRPNVRSWILEAFPSSGEPRILSYVQRAVREHLIHAIDPAKDERLDVVASADAVPWLRYVPGAPGQVLVRGQ